MSVPAINWAFRARVTPTQKLVLVCLASHADDRGTCWPSVARIMEMTGLCKRAVQGALIELRERGAIGVDVRRGARTTYTLLLSAFLDEPPAPRARRIRRTPAANSPAADARDPSISCTQPRHLVRETPAADAGELSRKHQGNTNEPSGARLQRPPGEIPGLLPPAASPPPRQAAAAPVISPETTAEFEAFWRAYPRKVGKDDARKSYAKARRRADGAVIAAALARQVWPEDAKFIPHPATWLNQGRWQDDPVAAAAPPPTETRPVPVGWY